MQWQTAVISFSSFTLRGIAIDNGNRACMPAKSGCLIKHFRVKIAKKKLSL